MENNYTLIIKVVGEEGEEQLSVNKVSSTDIEVITPMLEDIKNHGGWFPCGKFYKGGPTVRDLYRHHVGWDVFNSLIPNPPSGFAMVVSVELFNQQPLKIEMI